MARKYLLSIICFCLIFLFVYASVSKLVDLKGFRHDINNQPFPNEWTVFLVITIPGIELVTVTSLIFEKTRRLGLYLSALLMSTFTLYTILILLRVFKYVPCSCGGVLKLLTWPQHLVFNLLFVIISIIGLRIENRTKISANI